MHSNFLSPAHQVARRHNGPQRRYYRPVAKEPSARVPVMRHAQHGCQRKPSVFFLLFVAALIAAIALSVAASGAQ